eukprot:TRINITY_DN242_c0_g1_i2.p1 TRINITY_DN242_c0_g1~~TRINITY_DN242_c0_g1_i2.p1  ORF type:complete len:235 (+),score=89.01 TRINITY_DN242_c0_g1_i2:65-706(+)
MASPDAESPEYDARGLALKSALPPLPVAVVANIMFAGIGIGAAFGIYQTDKDTYDDKIKLLAAMDLQYLYLGFWLMRWGFFLLLLNSVAARRAALVNPPDQHVYEVYGDKAASGYVTFVKDGVIGRFNRAQRSVFNYLEPIPFVLASFVLGGFVMPAAAMIVGIVFTVVRIGNAIGYTSSTQGRFPGLVLGNVCWFILDGMVFVSMVKAFKEA